MWWGLRDRLHHRPLGGVFAAALAGLVAGILPARKAAAIPLLDAVGTP